MLKDAVLHVSKRLGLFEVARWLTRRELRILCYHGFAIADEACCRPQLFFAVDEFARRMDLLAAQRYTVLPLEEAVERLYAGTLPPATVVITIDDGFHAVYSRAASILKQHGFPSTVYVATYYVERDAPIFRFVVRYMFARAAGVTSIAPQPWLPEGAEGLQDPAVRDATIDAIIDFGERRCSEAERQQICRKLGEIVNVDYESVRSRRLLSLMNGRELRGAKTFGMDVQLHTHRHRFPLDRAAADAEISDNRRVLAQLLGTRRFEHFCYPSGVYDKAQWPWLEALGVKTATTCEPGLNGARTPRLGLRRFLDAPEVSAITFEAEMSGYLELARRIRAWLRGASPVSAPGRPKPAAGGGSARARGAARERAIPS